MLPVRDSFNIVLNGAWNPSIFNQSWILDHIADDQNANITIAFPLDDPTAPRKVSFEGLNLFPGRKQLLLATENSSLAGVRLCANKVRRILELLTHTPVSNCGINFHFEESNNLARVQEVLNFSDQTDIGTDSYRLISSGVTRKFRIDNDEAEMNLTIADTPSGVRVGFNFHYEVGEASQMRELITEEKVETVYNQAIGFCRNVYGLEIEDDEDEQ